MNPPIITKAQARAFRKRWKIANEREAEELRNTRLELKVQQLATLMEWARHFEWPEDRELEVAKVRERWARLRKAYGG